MKSVSPEELDKLLHDDDHDEALIDVRTPAEFASGHIKEAENAPLGSIEEVIEHLKGVGTVYVSCGTGVRSEQACKVLAQHGINVVNVEGGLGAWERMGKPIVGNGRKVIPIIRQVMIVAGSLILLGVILGYVFSPYWYLLSAFVGAGLLFAGISGICGMSIILAKMPWNRVSGQSCDA